MSSSASADITEVFNLEASYFEIVHLVSAAGQGISDMDRSVIQFHTRRLCNIVHFLAGRPYFIEEVKKISDDTLSLCLPARRVPRGSAGISAVTELSEMPFFIIWADWIGSLPVHRSLWSRSHQQFGGLCLSSGKM